MLASNKRALPDTAPPNLSWLTQFCGFESIPSGFVTRFGRIGMIGEEARWYGRLIKFGRLEKLLAFDCMN